MHGDRRERRTTLSARDINKCILYIHKCIRYIHKCILYIRENPPPFWTRRTPGRSLVNVHVRYLTSQQVQVSQTTSYVVLNKVSSQAMLC